MKKLTIILALFFMSVTLFAQSEYIIVDRPGWCYNSNLVLPKTLQAEYSLGYEPTPDAFANGLQLRTGINDNFELKYGATIFGTDVMGLNIGTKFVMFRNEGTTLGGLVMLDFNPNYSDSVDVLVPSAILIFQQDFGKRITLYSNLGTGVFIVEDAINFLGAVGLSYNNEVLIPYVEYFRDYDTSQYGTVGLILPIGKDVSIDAAGYWSFKDSEVARVEIGIGWNLKF